MRLAFRVPLSLLCCMACCSGAEPRARSAARVEPGATRDEVEGSLPTRTRPRPGRPPGAGVGTSAPPPSTDASRCAAIPPDRDDLRTLCRSLEDHPWFQPPAVPLGTWAAPNGDLLRGMGCLPDPPEEWLACRADADCEMVPLTPCPICNGGAAMVVNRASATAARSRFGEQTCMRYMTACTESLCEGPFSRCVAGACALERDTAFGYCDDDDACEAGQRCVAAPGACGGARRCLAVGVSFTGGAGCGIGED